jgi:hypothetical protein
MRRITQLLAALSVLPLAALTAQQNPLLEPGRRVRITAPGFSTAPTVATLVAVHPETLVVQQDRVRIDHGRRALRDSMLLHVPLTDVTELEVSTGTESQWTKGLAYGAGAGFLVGLALGAASGDDPPNQWFAMTAGEKALVGGVAFAAVGGVVGTVVGALIKVERWQVMSLDRMRVRVVASPRGFVLGASLRL